MKIAIIGGGIAGLVAAYTLAKKSRAEIVLIEQADKLGGLASSFEVENGHQIEKYYHFICKPDRTYFRLMRELGIYPRLRWKTTEMGLFYNGGLYTLDDPISLLRFRHLSLRDKMRFALAALKNKFTPPDSWRRIESTRARDWLIEQYGERTYKILYEPLLDLKFREYAQRISAAWMWARFYRLGRSRTITQKERIGFLEGGTQLYIDRLAEELRRRGAAIRLGARVEELTLEDGRIKGVRTGAEVIPCDHLISTIPLPLLLPLVDRLDGTYWDSLRSLNAIGVVVVMIRLARSVSKYFWMNIHDPRADIAGIIECTNLNPCRYLGGDSIIYVPQYVPEDHPLYTASDEDLLQLYTRYLQIINPEFDPSWIKQYWVHRDRFSQPICDLGFSGRIPSMQTPIENFYLTDSHQLHPHDRSVSASSDLGGSVAELVLEKVG